MVFQWKGNDREVEIAFDHGAHQIEAEIFPNMDREIRVFDATARNERHH